LADSNAMIVNSVLEAIFLDAGVNRFSLFEYSHPDNTQVLPITPLCAAVKGSSATDDAQDIPSISSPRFAAGQIFVPSLFGALFAMSYTTPGVMELMEALVMPSRRGQNTFPFMLPALERVATDWIGRTYGDLCDSLLSNGLGVQVDTGLNQTTTTYCLPLGLYRRAQEVAMYEVEPSTQVPPVPVPLGAAHQGMRFVYCNPEADVVLLPGDQVYLLAPANWINCVSYRAEAAEQDDNDRTIFQSLANATYQPAPPPAQGFMSSFMGTSDPGVSVQLETKQEKAERGLCSIGMPDSGP